MEWPRFAFPWALALLVAVPWTIWIGMRIQSLSTGRKWTAIVLRTVILLCLIAALAGMELVRITDDLAVFFLLDHSDSISEAQRLASAQWVRNVADEFMTEKDKAGVIVFGEDASIELSVDSTLGLRDILSYVGGEQTDLAAAIRLGLAAFPQGHMKRIVIYSDGNETRGTALEEVKLAQAGGVEVNTVPLRTQEGQDVRLRAVSTPSRVQANEPFQLRIVASAEQDTEATLRVFQRVGSERRLLAPQRVSLQKGDNTFVLTQELANSGFYEYEVTIESEWDTIPENNSGRAFTIVHGEPRVLYVESDPEHSLYLGPALIEEGIQVETISPAEIPTSLAQLQNYDALILSNVSSTDLSADQMRGIEAMVRDLGIGLIMIGGPESFGAGGYLDTPIENALPVDMDIKQRKILPRGALALVLHTVEFVDGNAWAREISLAALNVLSSQDLMGMLAYHWQGGDSWIHPLAPVGDKSSMRIAIRRGTQNIGDMPGFGPTMKMAYDALKSADAAAKRMIIISDGDPGAPPRGLVNDIKNAGIAVSTVCINPHSPSDMNIMRSISEKTGGQFYYVTDPQNLPQIFTKEASVVKRGLLIEKAFTPKVNHDSELLYGLGETGIPDLLGYVVTTPKETATVPLVSHEGDPILAHWRYGLGKSVAFTSDVTNRWAAPWLSWEGFDRFWSQTVRWATRDLAPSNFRVETMVRDGRGYIKIDAVDDSGRFINFLRPRGAVTGPGPEFRKVELELPQTAPGIYEGTFPLADSGLYMINILYTREDGTEGSIPAGLALGYSPEYEYATSNLPLLEQIASTGGGRMMMQDENPFEHTLAAAPAIASIWHLLVVIAACLFPLEIFIRRVVIPFAAIYDASVRGVRRVPGLRRLVHAPAPRPVPVTGTYRSAPARERSYDSAAEPSPSSFGATPATASADDALQPAGEEEPVKKAEAPSRSSYTQELLAAKKRAIERKTRRTEGIGTD